MNKMAERMDGCRNFSPIYFSFDLAFAELWPACKACGNIMHASVLSVDVFTCGSWVDMLNCDLTHAT